MTICIIPARKNSRRIPGKNIKMFYGKPIIAYSIESAIESGLFDHVIISTDGEDIARIAKEYGVKAMIRSPHLSVNEVGTQEVARDVIQTLGILSHESVCVMYAIFHLYSSR